MAGEDARSEERQGERGKQDKIDQGSLAAARTAHGGGGLSASPRDGAKGSR